MLLAEIQADEGRLFGTVVAQAQRIDVTADRIVFAFSPATSCWASRCSRTAPGSRRSPSGAPAGGCRWSPRSSSQRASRPEGHRRKRPEEPKKPADLKAVVLADPDVRALFDTLPSEIRGIEEIPDENS